SKPAVSRVPVNFRTYLFRIFCIVLLIIIARRDQSQNSKDWWCEPNTWYRYNLTSLAALGRSSDPVELSATTTPGAPLAMPPATAADAPHSGASDRPSVGRAVDAPARRWRSGPAAPCDENRDRPVPTRGRGTRSSGGSRLPDPRP